MTTKFASANYTAGQLNAIIKLLKKQAGEDGPDRFLRGEIVVSTPICGGVTSTASPSNAWTLDNEGNIHFTLTSNGFTREQWEQYLKIRGWRMGGKARQVLRKASDAPTNGVVYNIAVRPGKLSSDSDRITRKIRAAAHNKGWVKPHWEVAGLIRDTFTDRHLEQMGLGHIVTMHEPINDSDGNPHLLYSNRYVGGRWLNASYDLFDDEWNDKGGFAFAVPVGSQT